jgi:hypothetical protein
MNRRVIIRGVASMSALALAMKTVKISYATAAKPAKNPDAELIALCAKRCVMQEDEDRRWAAFVADEADYDKDEADARIAIMNRLDDRIYETDAMTLAGLQAKARAYIANKAFEIDDLAENFMQEVAELTVGRA